MILAGMFMKFRDQKVSVEGGIRTPGLLSNIRLAV